MTRRVTFVSILGALALAAAPALLAQQGAAPAPAPATPAAPARGAGGRGRAQQPPPPPPLTCSSKAIESDNKVPQALARQGFVSLFNGKDLTGWQALIDVGTLKFGVGLNPVDIANLSPAERTQKQKESNDVYLKHWSVVDGILVFDGVQANKDTGEKGGQNLQTVKQYDDIDLYVDWCMEQGGDSGVYLKNSPQVQMWFQSPGSGGLYNNEPRNNPLVVADNPADHWNTFHIIMEGDDMTTVWLNGKLVVDNVKYGNYFDRTKPLPARGNIELQYHGEKLYWKNIFVKELN